MKFQSKIFQSVGKFFHVNNNHLNIAYSIGVVIRFITIIHEVHLEVMTFIFCDFKGSLDFALHYQWGGDIVPIGFTDSDYLDDLD
jgi:hypothetical protein